MIGLGLKIGFFTAYFFMRELLDDLAKMFEPQAARKGLRFRVDTSGRLPDYVRVDAKRLRQVLINLLANAVKFTERGEVVLRVDYRMEVARFEIADTGPGIAPEDHARIFMVICLFESYLMRSNTSLMYVVFLALLWSPARESRA